MDEIRILHINSYYYDGKFYKHLYDSQVNMGLQIAVYVPTYKLSDNTYDYGNYTTLSQCFNKRDRFFFHYKGEKILKNIHGRYDVKQFDIIHAHSLFANGYIAYRLYKKYNIPYVVAVRNTDYNVFFKKMIHLRHLGRKILNNASQIVFISPSNKKLLIDNFISKSDKQSIEKKSVILPNGIENFWFTNTSSKQEPMRDNIIKIIQVGDIDKNKNVLKTLAAVNHLNSNGHDTKLTVIGKIRSKRIFEKIRLNPYLNYLGYLPKEALLTHLRNNDIFILPSYKETFGLVYVEAMTQGLPVIYTKGQGFDGQIPDFMAGLSVNPYSMLDIAQAILSISIQYEKYSNFPPNSLHKFSWVNIANQYLLFYNEIYNLMNKANN